MSVVVVAADVFYPVQQVNEICQLLSDVAAAVGVGVGTVVVLFVFSHKKQSLRLLFPRTLSLPTVVA